MFWLSGKASNLAVGSLSTEHTVEGIAVPYLSAGSRQVGTCPGG